LLLEEYQQFSGGRSCWIDNIDATAAAAADMVVDVKYIDTF
jgi:hypothetical protein